MSFFNTKKTVETTPFSEFFKNSSSGEKKKVYADVLDKATERQNTQVSRSRKLAEAN